MDTIRLCKNEDVGSIVQFVLLPGEAAFVRYDSKGNEAFYFESEKDALEAMAT